MVRDIAGLRLEAHRADPDVRPLFEAEPDLGQACAEFRRPCRVDRAAQSADRAVP